MILLLCSHVFSLSIHFALFSLSCLVAPPVRHHVFTLLYILDFIFTLSGHFLLHITFCLLVILFLLSSHEFLGEWC